MVCLVFYGEWIATTGLRTGFPMTVFISGGYGIRPYKGNQEVATGTGALAMTWFFMMFDKFLISAKNCVIIFACGLLYQ